MVPSGGSSWLLGYKGSQERPEAGCESVVIPGVWEGSMGRGLDAAVRSLRATPVTAEICIEPL